MPAKNPMNSFLARASGFPKLIFLEVSRFLVVVQPGLKLQRFRRFRCCSEGLRLRPRPWRVRMNPQAERAKVQGVGPLACLCMAVGGVENLQ